MVDGLLTVTEIAHLLGESHHGRVWRIAVSLGINTRLLKTPKRGKLKPHYNLDEIESIRRCIDAKEALRPPQAYLSIVQIAKQASCSPKAVRIAIAQLKIKPTTYANPRSGRFTMYFGPRKVAKLTRHLAFAMRGDEYYLTEICKLLGRSEDWVKSRINIFGICTALRRDDNGRLLSVISLSDLDRLITESRLYARAGDKQLTVGGLSDRLQVDWRTVQRLLPVCSVEPTMCCDRRGVPRNHYDSYVLAELRFALKLVDHER